MSDLKIDDAKKDVLDFVTKRFDELQKEASTTLEKPLSVSFRPEMRLVTMPMEIPDVSVGFYQDHMETISVEVIHVNVSASLVQLEYHVSGQESVRKNFATMSSSLFALMFKRAVLDPLA